MSPGQIAWLCIGVGIAINVLVMMTSFRLMNGSFFKFSAPDIGMPKAMRAFPVMRRVLNFLGQFGLCLIVFGIFYPLLNYLF